MNKIIISHRGIIEGSDPALENHPSQIKFVLMSGFHIEVDVWVINNEIFLGHYEPQYKVDKEFFYNDHIWIHCKNIAAIEKFASHPLCNAFMHDLDDVALTSKGFFWSFPRQEVQLTSRSIAVLPEKVSGWDLANCAGVCTDFPMKYKNLLGKV